MLETGKEKIARLAKLNKKLREKEYLLLGCYGYINNRRK